METDRHLLAVQVIESSWQRFVEKAARDWRIGDPRIYGAVDRTTAWHDSLNQFLKTENDLKLKFGLCIDASISEAEAPITVHSEMPVYEPSTWRSDLSLHYRTDPPVWIENDESKDALLAAIEVKYLNFKSPLFWIANGGIEGDIDKLATLSGKVGKFLLLLDEAGHTELEGAEELSTHAASCGVRILSNSHAFS